MKKVIIIIKSDDEKLLPSTFYTITALKRHLGKFRWHYNGHLSSIMNDGRDYPVYTAW